MSFDLLNSPALTLPDWALRFNYDHHSPSGLRVPFVKQLLSKTHPEVKDPPGVRMIAGKAGEVSATGPVIDGVPDDQAFRHALSRLDGHRSPAHIANDELLAKTIRDHPYKITKDKKTGEILSQETVFELTCRHTLEGLRDATKGANLIERGRWISVQLAGCELWFIGEIDVEAGGVVEIKTSWPSISATAKQGFKVKSLPTQPDKWHVRQVALYWKFLREQTENVPVKIVHSNCIGWRVFSSEDCPALSEASLSDALNWLAAEARSRENILRTAPNEKELFRLVSRDTDHWVWKDATPELKQLRDKLCQL